MKRRIIITVLAVAGFALAGATYAIASAAVGWPAGCSRVGCVDRHMNNLDARLRIQSQRIAALESWKSNLRTCLGHINMTGYSYYVYDNATNADRWIATLEQTHYGDNVDFQVIFNRCTPASF